MMKRDGAAEREVREAYEGLTAAFREGRLVEEFDYFADDATVADGGRWFGSLSPRTELPLPHSICSFGATPS